MSGWRLPGWRGFLLSAAVTLIAVAVLLLLVVLSGVYNVAAGNAHWGPTNWLIKLALHRSVWLYSLPVSAPPLNGPDLVRLGAGHYHGGCAPCHGSPDEARNPIVKHMLPAPPDLREAVRDWSTEELFWIVRNGLKFTGMPGWTAPQRRDEVWAAVAFLRELPGMDAARYRALALGNAEPVDPGGPSIARFGGATEALTRCIRCHGDGNSPPTSRLVPKLAGQKLDYLRTALRFYAEDRRPSGIMQPIAAALEPEEAEAVSRYYANLTAVRSGPGEAPLPADRIARGRLIAEFGVPQKQIPPCLACHHSDSAALFPRVAGQYAPYIETQLRLWQDGLRDRTAPGAIMQAIATRLTARQVEDVAAYFASIDAPPAFPPRSGAPTSPSP
ncbi:MAG: c-type cytochrome [Alphaproteobacteria bacterium]